MNRTNNRPAGYFSQRVKPLQKLSNVKDKLEFGKYRTYQVQFVLDNDPAYLEWALTEKIISVTKEIAEIIEDNLSYGGRR